MFNFKKLYLNAGESQTDGGSGTRRFQLLLGIGNTGKSFVIEAPVTLLKNTRMFFNSNRLVIVPEGKELVANDESTLHSHKVGLGLPVTTSKIVDFI